MSAPYRTLAARVRFEPEKIRGSRHIATLAPAGDEAEALGVIAGVRGELRAAGHHAFAWRLGPDGAAIRFSDDGEPAGAAGRPILAVLEGRALTQVVAVVSRIFGGTRLGVGGLVRAYGGAVAAALDVAEIVEVVPTVVVRIAVDWADAGAVEAILSREGLSARDRSFADGVGYVVDVPVAQVDATRAALRDGCQGRARVSCSEDGSDA